MTATLPGSALDRTLRDRRSLSRNLMRKAATAIQWLWPRAQAGGWRLAVFQLVSSTLKSAAPKLHGKIRRVVNDPEMLFDLDWYLSKHPDVAAAGWDPYLHYLAVGATLNYDPHPLFDTAWYLKQNPDVAARGRNPLVHYARDGGFEGRDPNPYFDSDWYRAHIADGDINPLTHYLRIGASKGLNPSPKFNTNRYLAAYDDVVAAGINPLSHYLLRGEAEGRSTGVCVGDYTPQFFRAGPRVGLGRIIEGHAPAKPSIISVSIGDLMPSQALPSQAPDAAMPSGRYIDVIVPVYRGVAETRRCIESVLQSRPLNRTFGKLILIDDCSPEPDIRAYLSTLAGKDGIVLLTNALNKGFVASVNSGVEVADRNDVLLLNSDTEVSGNWVDRLAAQMHADPRIATVTPFSNNATICSYPNMEGTRSLPAGLSLQEIDAACMAANGGRAVDLPTGVGFCMLVRRACLDDIGGFDARAFKMGYGEENDLCQRALNRGWRNILAGDVFVFHAGGTSFGSRSHELRAEARKVLLRRFPSYEADVARWVAKDPARALRLMITAALRDRSGKPVILHLLHRRGGGTEKQVADLTEKLAHDAHHLILVARRDRAETGIALLILEGTAWRIVDFTAAALVDVIPFLRSFGVSQIHVHHFLDIPGEVMEFLKRFGVPYDLTIHDYTTLCPRITLSTVAGTYCGEPDEKACLDCLSQGDGALSRDIRWWRLVGHTLTVHASRVLCPSIDAALRIRRYAPDANIMVVPHEDDRYRPKALRPRPLSPGEPMRVVVLGALPLEKGGEFLFDCVEAANRQDADITWCVIGEPEGRLTPRIAELGKVLSVSGRYRHEDLPGMIAEAKPHLVFFPQRCPETYCFTLSEAFAAGLPVLAPDIGAFPERIAGVPWSWVYPADLPAALLIETLLTVRTQLEHGRLDLAEPPTDIGTFPVQLDFYRDRYILARDKRELADRAPYRISATIPT